jgi:hypothetical protein
MSSDLAKRIAIAHRHVASGRSVLTRQRSVITRKNGLGIDASSAEDLLVLFEKSQAIFEDDLERLLRERDRK